MMSRADLIERFVNDLAAADPPDSRSCNIYRDPTRRANLKRWLETFEDTRCSALFVGEAPGRAGAAITGVPFVSPQRLTDGVPEWGIFGPGGGYTLPDDANPTQREATATMFWDVLENRLACLPRPMTWNAYPFWPHEAGSNRTPEPFELQFGGEWLKRFVNLHPESKAIAVGDSAASALASIDISHRHVKHPSHGGKAAFDDGVRRLGEDLRNRCSDGR